MRRARRVPAAAQPPRKPHRSLKAVVRRQREPWDRDALTALRHGYLDHFARAYYDHSRIVAASSAEAARAALHERTGSRRTAAARGRPPRTTKAPWTRGFRRMGAAGFEPATSRV
jgi:hypothetical protein